MDGKRTNYRVQSFERQCSKCLFRDSFREPIFPGDRGGQTIHICILDRDSVSLTGICEKFKRQEKKK